MLILALDFVQLGLFSLLHSPARPDVLLPMLDLAKLDSPAPLQGASCLGLSTSAFGCV